MTVPTAPTSALMPTRIGRYDVVREIGRGGMGCVFEGTHHVLGRSVAIKRLRDDVAGDAVTRARLLAEGRAIARLRHPHIVEVLDFEDIDGVPHLVMELLEGLTLAEHLERRGALLVEEAVDLILPIVSALAAAHTIGVVHRDVKPANVFLRTKGDRGPCLLDFGVSTRLESDGESLTRSDALLGSFPYFSPEHARGARRVHALSDQFSLAIVLYECVTGVRPFQGHTPYELMHAIVRAEVEPPSSLRSGIPGEFDAVLLRALRPDPVLRYPSMTAFGSALLSFASAKAWHRWARELAGAPELGSVEHTQDDGLGDERAATSLSVQPPRTVRPRQARLLAAALLLAVVASAAFVAGQQAGRERTAAPAIVPSVAANADSVEPSRAPAPPARVSPVEVATPTSTTPAPSAPSAGERATRTPRARPAQEAPARSVPSPTSSSVHEAPPPSPAGSGAEDVLNRWE